MVQTPVATSSTLAGIHQAIENFEMRIQQIREEGESGLRGATDISAEVSLEDLQRFIDRLKTIEGWLREDEGLVPVVDRFIAQQVRNMEQRAWRKNLALTIVTTVAGAALGWLLAALVSPDSLLHWLGR